ncbi:type II secretion system F family protein [Teredinibacter franksiae]|uniref:type II secretion system F family protein n=1 Tax=Teredinibacter franksiae TaxID=2761453 RepID=UPI0016249A9F|nr:type II secretion system F family protein [Teredinibacter franksiae]
MPRYSYEGYSSSGLEVSSVLAASSKESALADLEASGLLITNIHQVLSFGGASKVPTEALYRFNQELLSVTRAGIPLVDSLKMVIPRDDSPLLTSILEKVIDKLSSGSSFSVACKDFPEAFDPIYLASIQTSEHTGDLVEALQQYNAILSRKLNVDKSIKAALYYPAFLASVLVVVLAVLFVFVIPSFSELYDSFDAALPGPTQVILAIAAIAPYAIVASAILLLVATITWKLSDKPKLVLIRVDRALNRVPVIGKTRVNIQFSQIMRMLSGLLVSGSPLVDSLRITAQSFSDKQVGLDLTKVAKSVEHGESFSQAMKHTKHLSSTSTKMLQTGEKSGNLGPMIGELANKVEGELESQLKQFTSLFEPVVMLFLGLIVGFVIVAMYLPIFYLADVVS